MQTVKFHSDLHMTCVSCEQDHEVHSSVLGNIISTQNGTIMNNLLYRMVPDLTDTVDVIA